MGSVAVSKDGKLLYSRSTGYLDAISKTPANENSKYRIGSISKTFTATLALIAIEKNKLALTETIDKYFPGIQNANKITIEQLMYHRSGIHDFTEDNFISWLGQSKSKSDMVEIMVRGGSDFEPDSKAQYSNSNFVLLSYILEDVFDEPYPHILKKYILDPLKLHNTYYGGPIDHKVNECGSFYYEAEWKNDTETDMSIPQGAGGIVSSPLDLIRFGNALFSGKLISHTSLEKMTTVKDQFGLGLFQVPFDEKRGFGHTGGIDGFRSLFFYFPEDKVSFALTSNGSNYNNNDIAIAVMSTVFNKPFAVPEFTEYKISAEELNPFPGIYASDMIPLKITITKKDNTLIAQATGQESFPLEATGPTSFKFDPAGITLEFIPGDKMMVLKQGGGEYMFKMEK